MIALMSIKPEYANKIFAGEKDFEFRKVIFNSQVTRVEVYASSPVCGVIGWFEVLGVLKGEPLAIWNMCNSVGGIDRMSFFKYFSRRSVAYAVRIGERHLYKDLRSLEKYGVHRPPQSYCYLNELI